MSHHVQCRRGAAAAAAIALSIMAACGPADGSSTDDHGHAHGDATMAATGWSATHEVHLAGDMPIAGHAAALTLYLSDSGSGAPAAEAPVMLEWSREGGDAPLRSVAVPSSRGRYAVNVTLPDAGPWRLVATPEGAASVTVEAIVVAGHDHDADHEGGPGYDAAVADEADVITMSKARQWRLGVAATIIAPSPFARPLRVAATVEAPPQRRMPVVTPVDGRITAVADRPMPALGQRVLAGEPLLAVAVPLAGDAGTLTAAEADLVRAREDLQLAEAEQQRAETLVDAGAAPARRLSEAEAAVRAARARHDAAARLLADGTGDGQPRRILTAPIDGVVTEVHAAIGRYLAAGEPVLTILDPSVVWVRGHIPETALHGLPPAPRARLGIHGDVGTVCDIEGADLVYLAPEIDPRSRTAAVVYAVTNHDLHLRVGQSLGLALETAAVSDGLVVPNAAIVDEHGRPTIFVQTGGERFERRRVVIDGRDAHRSLIASGLAPGDRVVTAAAWAVKLAGVADAAPGHGHTH
jgi:cobalt-zinc-cadmium efflux system membrane fusion protein